MKYREYTICPNCGKFQNTDLCNCMPSQKAAARKRASNLKKEPEMSKLKAIRHGECMLVPISKKVVGEAHNSFVVAHSETQHHHVLESKKPFTVSQSDKEFLIELFEPAKLVHKKTIDKHQTLTVAPGRYKVVYKNEYDPFQKVIRRVTD